MRRRYSREELRTLQAFMFSYIRHLEKQGKLSRGRKFWIRVRAWIQIQLVRIFGVQE